MKKKFTAKDILIPTVSLFVICLVVTALLAVTNMLTAPQIQKLSKETEDKGRGLSLGRRVFGRSYGECRRQGLYLL